MEYSIGRPESAVHLSQLTADKVSCSVEQLVSGTTITYSFQKSSDILPPFATDHAFSYSQPQQTGCWSFRFYPPRCYQVSLAGISSLLRIHLPPHTASDCLEFPLDVTYPLKKKENSIRLPRLRRTPCEQCHPQTHNGSDQVWGFALFCTLTHP